MEAAGGSGDSIRDQALAQLKRKREFKASLVVFVVINLLLWLIWLISDDRGNANGVPWPLWVTVFWGFGMLIGAWNVYGQQPISDADLEEEMRKIRGEGPTPGT
jgi:hypothetical protein